MIRICALVSGSGTDLQAMLDKQQQGILKTGSIVLVASDKADAPALQRSLALGIASVGFDKKQLGKTRFEEQLLALMQAHQIDLIVLAGFLTILSSSVIHAYENRMVNIHPSLIPSFCGKGYYGIRVHQAAIERGVKLSGATVHLVTEEADAGPILAQQALAVLENDTAESLGKRILETIEWELLPRTVEQYCQILEQNMNLKKTLQALRYPGRGIVCGMNDEGHSIIAYFITARSTHSKNRQLLASGTTVRTDAIDPSLVKDPSLIIYRAMEQSGSKIVVSNGDQTDTILEGLEHNQDMSESLKTRTFEPDEPNYTSRISGVVDLENGGAYTLSILRRKKGDCERSYFPYQNPISGKGHLIHTYQKDAEPLPPFVGEPKQVTLKGSGSSLAKEIWESLDSEYKVALCVRETNLSTGSFELFLINAQQRR